jgi:hypothetical protein
MFGVPRLRGQIRLKAELQTEPAQLPIPKK